MALVYRRRWVDPRTGATKESAHWFLRYRDPITSEEVRRRTKPATANRKTAEMQLSAAIRGAAADAPGDATMADVFGDYLEYLRVHHRSTHRSCGSRLAVWTERFGDLLAAQFGRREIEAGVAELRRRKLSDSTIHGHLTLVRAAVRRAVELEVLRWHPLTTLKIRLRPGLRRSVWTDAEFAAVRKAFRVAWARDVFDVLRATGLRLSDALALRWDAVDRGTISVRAQKTGTDLDLPLASAAGAVLARITRTASPYVFPATRAKKSRTGHRSIALFTRYFCEARRLALVPHRSLHDVRRTFAHRAMAGGASPAVVAALLGHQTTSMVPRYAWAELEAVRRAAEDGARGADMAE